MSENLLFAVTPHTQDTSNALLVHENIKTSQGEHLVFGTTQHANLNKDIVSSLTPDWYQKDLAHMTTNLMKVETNATATALNTTLSPRLMSRSASFNDNVYGGYYPNNWGSVDLSGLVNNGGGDGGFHNRPDVIRLETARAKEASIDIFHNVFNRDPNNTELNSATKAVYTDSDNYLDKYNNLQKKLSLSKEGHDRIANIGIDVLGYAPSEELIKQEQAKLAKYGTTQQDIRKDFANSQVAYDQYANMAKNMLGHDADAATIRNMQDQARNGSKYTDVRNNLAHSGLGRQVAVNMMKNMGFTPSEQDIKWTQDQLGAGRSSQSVLSEHAHGFHGREVAVNMMKNMGVSYSEQDIAWSQDRFGEGKSNQWVFYEHTHGYLGDAAADDVYNKLTGNHLTAADGDWRNMAKDRIYEGGGKQNFFYNEAHGVLGDAAADDVYNKLTGNHLTAADGDWRNMAKDRIYEGGGKQNFFYNEAHGVLGDAAADDVYNKLTGNHLTAADGDWRNMAKDRIYEGGGKQNFFYNEAHGVLGDAAADDVYNKLTGNHLTAADGDWRNMAKDRIYEGGGKQNFFYNEAHGVLGDAAADDVYNKLTGNHLTAADGDWRNMAKDRIYEGGGKQNFFYNEAHGVLGDAAADDVYNKLTGSHLTAADGDWRNMAKDRIYEGGGKQNFFYNEAHGVLGDAAADDVYYKLTGNHLTGADGDWRDMAKNRIYEGGGKQNFLHNEAHGVLGTAMVQQMAKNKGVILTQTAIEDQQNLIEKQGIIPTQQQFYQTYDVYYNIAGSNDIIFADKIVNYQQLGSKKEIIKAIYKDLSHTIDPSFKVNLVDDDGQIIYGGNPELTGGVSSNKPVQISVGNYETTLEIIGQAEKIDRSSINKPVYEDFTSPFPEDIFTKIVNFYNLQNFRPWGPWDIQRLYVTSGIDHDLRDISTVNIGIYAAASGMSLNEILNIENTFAYYKSSFKGQIMSPQYEYLAERNVNNTKIGYELYKNGKIKAY